MHEGIELRFTQRGHRIDFRDLTGRWITVYGQQEVVKDLIAALLADGVDIRFESRTSRLSDLTRTAPHRLRTTASADARLRLRRRLRRLPRGEPADHPAGV